MPRSAQWSAVATGVKVSGQKASGDTISSLRLIGFENGSAEKKRQNMTWGECSRTETQRANEKQLDAPNENAAARKFEAVSRWRSVFDGTSPRNGATKLVDGGESAASGSTTTASHRRARASRARFRAFALRAKRLRSLGVLQRICRFAFFPGVGPKEQTKNPKIIIFQWLARRDKQIDATTCKRD